MWKRGLVNVLIAGTMPAGLLSCHEEDPLARAPTFSIGGTIAGSAGLLTLQNSNGTTISVAADGSFEFPTPMVHGASYKVTVVVPPAAQRCEVANGAGTVGLSDITQVAVSCATDLKLAAVAAKR